MRYHGPAACLLVEASSSSGAYLPPDAKTRKLDMTARCPWPGPGFPIAIPVLVGGYALPIPRSLIAQQPRQSTAVGRQASLRTLAGVEAPIGPFQFLRRSSRAYEDFG